MIPFTGEIDVFDHMGLLNDDYKEIVETFILRKLIEMLDL